MSASLAVWKVAVLSVEASSLSSREYRVVVVRVVGRDVDGVGALSLVALESVSSGSARAYRVVVVARCLVGEV